MPDLPVHDVLRSKVRRIDVRICVAINQTHRIHSPHRPGSFPLPLVMRSRLSVKSGEANPDGNLRNRVISDVLISG